MTAQTLVGYFIGSRWVIQARRVASYTCSWGLALGLAMGAGMWLSRDMMATLLVPPEAHAAFFLPWIIAAVVQPINALAFVTDGIHWGTGDFAFLRNAVLLATFVGSLMLLLIDTSSPGVLAWIWVATAVWIIIRALFGMLRIWPGIGKAPLGEQNTLEFEQKLG